MHALRLANPEHNLLVSFESARELVASLMAVSKCWPQVATSQRPAGRTSCWVCSPSQIQVGNISMKCLEAGGPKSAVGPLSWSLGDFSRIARVRAILDAAKLSTRNMGDDRVSSCMNAVKSVEGVLKKARKHAELSDFVQPQGLPIVLRALPRTLVQADHGSFQKPIAVSPGVLMVFWKEGSLERMGKCPLEE